MGREVMDKWIDRMHITMDLADAKEVDTTQELDNSDGDKDE